MKIEFQEDLLKFLAQRKEAKKYIEILDADIFDLDIHKTVYSLLKGFTKKYHSQPSIGNLLEYFDREIKQSKFKGEDLADAYKEVEKGIKDIFIPITAATEQIREIILEEYQLKLMRQLFVEKAGQLKTGNVELIKDVFKEVSNIKKIGETDLDEEANKGKFALQEYQKGQRAQVEGMPTYLKSLNKMTAVGGFHSPQLVIFMGGPKSFKTGTLLSIAMNYVRDGKKVYYVDCENGEDMILDRFYQSMLEVTWKEYDSGQFDDVLEEMVGRFKALGGDFMSDYYPAYTKTVADVEERLDFLKSEHGWIPDIICWDYLDLLSPTDKFIKEKRLQIQRVYFEAIGLQKKIGMLGLSLSQISKEAVAREHIDMTSFAEDFGKAANCHAAFALMRNEDEKENGLMRVVPVLQRQGVGAHSRRACFVSVDEGRMSMREISHDEWSSQMKDIESKKPVKKQPPAKGGSVIKRPKRTRDE